MKPASLFTSCRVFILLFTAVNSFSPSPRRSSLFRRCQGIRSPADYLNHKRRCHPPLRGSLSLLSNDAAADEARRRRRRRDEGGSGSSYDSSGSFAKGIVSSLTSISNFLFQSPSTTTTTNTNTNNTNDNNNNDDNIYICHPPATSEELLLRIANDYVCNNYLWTGNIDVSSFRPDCRFVDPTLSFVGVDTFASNVGSLVPLVEWLLGPRRSCRSELLSIANEQEEGYVETRWNMVGELDALPWKPRIDVIGRTKFWYGGKNDVENEIGSRSVQVHFYDELWEIPVGWALLQLVTPAGTIANSNCERGE